MPNDDGLNWLRTVSTDARTILLYLEDQPEGDYTVDASVFDDLDQERVAAALARGGLVAGTFHRRGQHHRPGARTRR